MTTFNAASITDATVFVSMDRWCQRYLEGEGNLCSTASCPYLFYYCPCLASFLSQLDWQIICTILDVVHLKKKSNKLHNSNTVDPYLVHTFHQDLSSGVTFMSVWDLP